jgi:cobalt-zinc-cadmium efflux system membrane fusion protein
MPEAGNKTPREKDQTHEEDDYIIKLSAEQIALAKIETEEANPGVLGRRAFVPGSIIPSGDRIARVAVKIVGTVAELRKRLGDPVEQNEVVAVIESREVADAKSEYLASLFTHELQETLSDRARRLVDSKAMAENEYFRTRAAFNDARVKRDVARQKLSALGLTEEQIAALPQQPVESLRLQELRSPISGRIAERRVDLGALVGREGQESELFVIVDLSEVWIELAVASADLPEIEQGHHITVISGATGEQAQARIMFVSPLLDKDTRAARVVAVLANPAHRWKPGVFVTAEIQFARQNAGVVIPKSALQSIKGERVVFVRTGEGFQLRKVTLGQEDDRAVEILSGLSTAEKFAVTNTFILKAELGKSEVEHED